MSPNPQNQIAVILSDKALEEYELLAEWENQLLRSILRTVLEQNYLSPSFGAAVQRAKRGLELASDRLQDDEEGMLVEDLVSNWKQANIEDDVVL